MNVKETLKKVTDVSKNAGKKVVDTAKKHPVYTGLLTGAALYYGLTVVKTMSRSKQKVYNAGFNDGIKRGALDAKCAISNYVAGKNGVNTSDVMNDFDKNVLYVETVLKI